MDGYGGIDGCAITLYLKYDAYVCFVIPRCVAIAMVTFDVPREIYAHNMPVDREI